MYDLLSVLMFSNAFQASRISRRGTARTLSALV
jgi:hypothetical protein